MAFKTNQFIDDIKKAFDYFNNNLYDISFFNCDNIYITNDFENDAELFFDSTNKISFQNTHGMVILPNNIVEKVIILISVDKEFSQPNICSLFHEFVHIYDLNHFLCEYTDYNYTTIEDHNLFPFYRNWSEFKAYAYSELYSYIYSDLILKTSYEKELLYYYDVCLIDFVKRTYDRGWKSLLYDYKLYSFLGSIYGVDIYNHIFSIEESRIHPYFFAPFYSKIVNQIYELYCLYFESDRDHKIFHNLQKIKDIECSLYGLHP